MLIFHTNVYRLEPTEVQAIALAQWVGACHYVYNLTLDQRRMFGRPTRVISCNSQQAEITALRTEKTGCALSQ